MVHIAQSSGDLKNVLSDHALPGPYEVAVNGGFRVQPKNLLEKYFSPFSSLAFFREDSSAAFQRFEALQSPEAKAYVRIKSTNFGRVLLPEDFGRIEELTKRIA